MGRCMNGRLIGGEDAQWHIDTIFRHKIYYNDLSGRWIYHLDIFSHFHCQFLLLSCIPQSQDYRRLHWNPIRKLYYNTCRSVLLALRWNPTGVENSCKIWKQPSIFVSNTVRLREKRPELKVCCNEQNSWLPALRFGNHSYLEGIKRQQSGRHSLISQREIAVNYRRGDELWLHVGVQPQR